ncbi:MAG: hypothetical protein COU90_04310 [Candidatus Ryanbacteria bacterium CG10_big_fil_rev_8_21_14_0_10_43_42]|uniref:DM13 domain-containing protein n=1 Tax=Candidatus Ryanbacteria bacterium CG10_big_fil_rev_8_21_14_0_10_43_42 TaxID=1974864 RepID=A0A2M8KVV6_9BACT|nr:MAG: hypothetical protein COU90_04310 [Candidatus Ryanbacteria bacterium CG10_big_fil_rev_8_21_14_0_10_43_42]
MKSFLFIAVSLIIFGAGWYFISPLVVNKEIDEQFPDVSVPTSMPTSEELAEMSPEQLDAIKENVMAETAAMPDTIMEEDMPHETEPVILAKGMFKDADGFHRGSGDAVIYQLPDGSRILRFENFSVTNGPDLRVLLVGHTDPKTRDDVMDGDYVELDNLKGNKGNQNYELSADIDITAYQSVVIYCKPFHVVFSTALLQ